MPAGASDRRSGLNLTAKGAYFADFVAVQHCYDARHCMTWSADAPPCPRGPNPCPVAGHRALPAGAAGVRPRGARIPVARRRRHRGGAAGGDGGLSVFLSAGRHGPDAPPVHPSGARVARRCVQHLCARARPAPSGRGQAVVELRCAAQHGVAGPDRGTRRAVRARHGGPALYPDAAGHVDRRLRDAGHAHHRHGEGQHRHRAARLDRHAALRHGPYRRAHRSRLGEGADRHARWPRPGDGQRLAGRLRRDAAGAMEPAHAGAAPEAGSVPRSEDSGQRTSGRHADRRVLYLCG